MPSRRKVQIEDSIRSLQDDFELCEFLDDPNLQMVFFPLIRDLFSVMQPYMSEDGLEAWVLRCLQEVPVRQNEGLRRHLGNREMPFGWWQDQANWERCYEAAAACLVQAYYDDGH
jgi:hypothetical protein